MDITEKLKIITDSSIYKGSLENFGELGQRPYRVFHYPSMQLSNNICMYNKEKSDWKFRRKEVC